jgi:predicted transcriptional regulator
MSEGRIMRKKKESEIKLLSETELELMTHLWRLGEGTVSEVMAVLPPTRKLAYTSVSTILRILEQKEFVGAKKEGRGHIYYPLLSKEGYESMSLRHLVTTVFDSTPSSLVKRLIETEDLSEEEMNQIHSILNKKRS